jgi:type II secretory pathway component PulJ
MPVLPIIFKQRDIAPRHLKSRPGSTSPCNQLLRLLEARAAFTLVEVLVSTVILLFIILLFSSIFNNVSMVWRDGLADIDRSNNGGIACDLIGRDIQSALLPANRSNTANLQFVVSPTGLVSSYGARDCIFFQAPVVVGSTSGDIAEVCATYQLMGPRPV